MNNNMKAEKSKVLDILNKFSFILGQRAGRELWLDKPKEVQDKDLFNFNEDVKCIKNYIEKNSRPIWHKVTDGDLPESNQEIRWIDKTGEHYNGAFHTNIKTLSGDVQMFSSDLGCDFYKDEVIAWTELPEYKE